MFSTMLLVHMKYNVASRTVSKIIADRVNGRKKKLSQSQPETELHAENIFSPNATHWEIRCEYSTVCSVDSIDVKM